MKVRRPKFDLQKKLVRHYFKGNIFSTHLANSLHIIFPEGEKFFIRSCRKFLNQIEDPKLKKDVKAFMGQEGVHAVAHNDFWQFLEKQGFNVTPFANFVDKTISHSLEKFTYKLIGKEKGAELCLAVTAGLEHYTSLLAEVAFENEDEFKHLPEEMRHLWFWHASEEIEHKSVAYDLLRHINDDEVLKNVGFTVGTVLLSSYTFIGLGYFVLSDDKKDYTNWTDEFMGFIESIAGPIARKLYSNSLSYYKRDFHPSQFKNDHWAEAYFAENERYHEKSSLNKEANTH